jgi:GTP cyclohydrolase I
MNRPGEAPLEDLVRAMLERIGEDPDREGLDRTPGRVARSWEFLTQGYGQTVADVVGEGVFREEHHNMVVVKDIEMYSMCEHHMLPFYGRAHVAYIPQGKVLGLSKIPRVVEMFARRLQVQERMTVEIADFVESVIDPRGVAVVAEGIHMCSVMRGVRKENSRMVTSAMRGTFREDDKTRSEFLGFIQGAMNR